ncbi:MAG: hypothetical protein K8R92_11835 [Planctomycetes bacterium]|nr:hypothetical protein [Planctomycetota bacterium]
MSHRITRFAGPLAMILLCGCASTPAKDPAQQDPAVAAYVARVRSELSTGKAHIINQVMRLTPEEAAKFWPIYAEYEADLFVLGDRRIALIKRYLTAIDTGKVDNATADAIAKDWLKLQRDEVDLMQSTYTRLAAEVSPIHAAQFLQIEHRTNTVIDLVIASEMPLAEESAAGSGGR